MRRVHVLWLVKIKKAREKQNVNSSSITAYVTLIKIQG